MLVFLFLMSVAVAAPSWVWADGNNVLVDNQNINSSSANSSSAALSAAFANGGTAYGGSATAGFNANIDVNPQISNALSFQPEVSPQQQQGQNFTYAPVSNVRSVGAPYPGFYHPSPTTLEFPLNGPYDSVETTPSREIINVLPLYIEKKNIEVFVSTFQKVTGKDWKKAVRAKAEERPSLFEEGGVSERILPLLDFPTVFVTKVEKGKAREWEEFHLGVDFVPLGSFSFSSKDKKVRREDLAVCAFDNALKNGANVAVLVHDGVKREFVSKGITAGVGGTLGKHFLDFLAYVVSPSLSGSYAKNRVDNFVFSRVHFFKVVNPNYLKMLESYSLAMRQRVATLVEGTSPPVVLPRGNLEATSQGDHGENGRKKLELKERKK